MPPIIQSPVQIGSADGRQDGTMQADDALYPELRKMGWWSILLQKQVLGGFFVIILKKKVQVYWL